MTRVVRVEGLFRLSSRLTFSACVSAIFCRFFDIPLTSQLLHKFFQSLHERNRQTSIIHVFPRLTKNNQQCARCDTMINNFNIDTTQTSESSFYRKTFFQWPASQPETCQAGVFRGKTWYDRTFLNFARVNIYELLIVADSTFSDFTLNESRLFSSLFQKMQFQLLNTALRLKRCNERKCLFRNHFFICFHLEQACKMSREKIVE